MRVYRRKIKNGFRWYLDYTDNNGKRVRKASKGLTKNEAEAELSMIRSKLLVGKDVPTILVDNLDSFTIRYLDYCQKTHTDGSFQKDRLHAENFREYLKGRNIKNLSSITQGLMQEIQAEYLIGHSRKSWNNYLGVVKAMLNKAVQWGVIGYNPIAQVKPLKIDRTFHYFSKKEIADIIEEAPEPMKTAIIILVNTGMRRSELFNLRWRDVDLENHRITIKPHGTYTTKNRKIRSIPMTDKLYNHLKNQVKKPVGYVCQVYEDPNSVWRTFMRILKKLAIKGTLHDLRHTFASHLAMAGVPIPAISELLGHSDIQTTMIYAHLSPETHQAAVKLLNL